MKADLAREQEIVAQGEARRAKNAVQKEKRLQRKNKLVGEIIEAKETKPEKSEQKADAKKKAAIAAKKTSKTEAKPKATKKAN